MLLRLAYLTMSNAFVVLRLLPMSDREKKIEILALRHRITVLERQLGREKVRFTLSDRALASGCYRGRSAPLTDHPGHRPALAPSPGRHEVDLVPLEKTSLLVETPASRSYDPGAI